METDDLELDTLGDRKTALFVIISDTDDTFNFIVAMMYFVQNGSPSLPSPLVFAQDKLIKLQKYYGTGFQIPVSFLDVF